MVIKLEDVTVRKNGKIILGEITLHLSEKRIGIVGSNGSGKSTFAKLLNGLETASTGSVLVGDDATQHKSALKKVGFVFQNPDNQIVFPLVDEDLAFGLKKSGLTKSEIKDRVRNHLDRFGLFHLIDRRTHELSGGEKQLVALIGVLVMQPEIIVLDEPTTLLDLRNRAILLTFLQQLRQDLIIVSHDLELMAEMDRVIWIDNGKIRMDGTAESVLLGYRTASQVGQC
jgi:biotin transport system ATP-binding protein